MCIAERNVEVVTSMEHQDHLIYSCHHGVTNSIESAAAAGHFGRDKMFTMFTQVRKLKKCSLLK